MSTPDKRIPYYLAGPMTGLPKFNYPAFLDAAERLRREGFSILNPVDLDSKDAFNAALCSPDGLMPDDGVAGVSYGELLGRDVALIADKAGGVIVLPKWEKSRGARLEVFLASRILGFDVWEYRPELEHTLCLMTPDEIINA